jgi:phosphomevalonate kinase
MTSYGQVLILKERVLLMHSHLIQTPGKLYIAGEYAVVKGYHALILKTKVTLDVYIEPSDTCIIKSQQFSEDITFQPNEVHVHKTLWASALKSAYKYVLYHNKQIMSHTISIQSGLDSEQHKKLGLGSSGALTVGLIEAVLKFHDMSYTPLILYKLAVIAQHKVNSIASYGDIATASYKSAILYKKFKVYDEDFSEKKIHMPWDGLVITPFEVSDLPLLIINTGMQASSHALVSHAFKHMKKHIYTDLFKSLDTLTLSLYERIIAHEAFKKLIEDMHKIYLTFPEIVLDKIINAPVLDLMNLEALKPYPKKISGAGGGDNIILYVPRKKEVIEIIKALKGDQKVISQRIEGVKSYE